MALFDPGFSRCALCDKVLHEGDDLVGTTHFIGDESDPLYRFSDALMHRSCFLRWEHRAAFVDAYNAEMGDMHRMRADGSIKDRRVFRIAEWFMDKVAALEAVLRRRRN